MNKRHDDQIDSDDYSRYENLSQASTKGVVLIQEWWGLNEEMAQVTEFSAAGFKALAPDLYRGKVAIDHEEAGRLSKGLDYARAIRLVAACVDYLKAKGCTKVGVVGFWYCLVSLIHAPYFTMA